MKASAAIKKFIGTPGVRDDISYPPASVSEIKELKDATTTEEWQRFGLDACAALGVPFEATGSVEA